MLRTSLPMNWSQISKEIPLSLVIMSHREWNGGEGRREEKGGGSQTSVTLSLFLLLYLPAKDVLWGRWLINHFYHLIKGLLDLLHWFTQISFVLCQLNHTHMPSMFLHLLMIILVMHLLHSYVTKMLLHSIFSVWLAGLKPLLVNCSPLYIQTVGGNSWAKSFNHSFCPEASLIKL